MTLQDAPPAPAPGLMRRMACLLYEGVLLFGVVMAAGLLYGILTGQRHALEGTLGLQLLVFMALGIYFVVLWTRGGQTLAMQTWQVRLVTADGQALGKPRALLRYLLSWLWFVPALAIARWTGLQGALPIAGALLAGVLGYAALSYLHPQRQFLHDAICGTRLIRWRPTRRA